MLMVIFLIVMLCGLTGGCQHFGGIYHILLQDDNLFFRNTSDNIQSVTIQMTAVDIFTSVTASNLMRDQVSFPCLFSLF
jgi:hypothetical protein